MSDSKELILNAAKTLFASKGYNATTIRDIAESAKLNSSMISYYFGSKEGLLKELMVRLYNVDFADFANILNDPVNNISEFRIRLAIFMETCLKEGIKNWELIVIIIRETYELCKFPEFNQANLEWQDVLKNYIKRAQKKSIIRKEIDALVFADTFFAILLDQISMWELSKLYLKRDITDAKTRKKWINNVLEIYINGMQA